MLYWLQLHLLLAAWAPQSMQDELRLPQNVTGAGQALSAARVLACYCQQAYRYPGGGRPCLGAAHA